MTEREVQSEDFKSHVIFLHNHLRKSSQDRYMIDLARGLSENGHKVTIMTSSFDTANCFEEVHPLHGSINVKHSAWFLPNDWDFTRAIVMAFRLCFFPPKPTPKVIITDVNTVAIYILAKFTKYKIILLSHLSALKYIDHYSNYITITPDLRTALTIRYADEVIVETECLKDIFKRSFPNYSNEIKCISPCVDTGEWLEETIDMKKIIPDLPENVHLFVAFGPYKLRSKFKFALDAFENLLFVSDAELRNKFYFVVAGDFEDDESYRSELMDVVSEKTFASQVTFLKQVTVVQKKTLLKACVAVLVPCKYDPFPDSVTQALMAKKPIIAVNSGFAKRVLTHRINGVVLPANVQKFAMAMNKLVEDQNVRMYICEMTRDLFNCRFSFDYVSRKINSIVAKYVDVCGENDKR